MIDNFFTIINLSLTDSGFIAFAASFVWGICSVIFCPCFIACIPLVIAYISGFTEDKKIKNAFWYSALFSLGLFIVIALIGVITSLAGQILGLTGGICYLIIGVFFLIIGIHLLGFLPISIPGLEKLRATRKGMIGALLLGSSYGIVSGPCTFGFIAPMLAMVALQKTALRGISLIIIFALGQCIPILIAGTSTGWVKRIVESRSIQWTGIVFKKIAGIIFILIALYLLIRGVTMSAVCALHY
ncbi:MAG: cytochrome c biogenesis CcdA family protein [Candidatus Hydrogenedentota bacterium]